MHYTTQCGGSLGSWYEEDRIEIRKTAGFANYPRRFVERTLRPLANEFEEASSRDDDEYDKMLKLKEGKISVREAISITRSLLGTLSRALG